MAADLVAVDTETTSLDEMRAEIVGISFSVHPGEAAYVPLAHNYPTRPTAAARRGAGEAQALAGRRPKNLKLGQHVKYDRHVFANHGIEVQGYAHDTMLQSYVLEVHKPHGLASLAERHLGRSGISYEDLCGKGAHQIGSSQVDIAKAAEYSCEDSDQTLDVHLALWPRCRPTPRLLFIYQLEIQSSETLYRIERNGVLIDAPTLAAQSHELGQRIMQLEAEAHDPWPGSRSTWAARSRSARSSSASSALPVVKKTPPAPPAPTRRCWKSWPRISRCRPRSWSTAACPSSRAPTPTSWPRLALPRTGRVHTHYAQAVAVTGRLSSNDPNLQNIPIRTAEGRRVREAFVAPPGSVIASADYSQIELRIMAHISDDAALLRPSPRAWTCTGPPRPRCSACRRQLVSSEQRRYAKVINFGLIYGMSAFGLARSLGSTTRRPRTTSSGISSAMKASSVIWTKPAPGAREPAMSKPCSAGACTCRRSARPTARGAAAPSARPSMRPMQGTAADLIKLSMVQVQQVLDSRTAARR
jgi:DNA polymerase-1